MQEQFVPYELAAKLKELGFDSQCLGYYDMNKQFYPIGTVFNGDKLNFGVFIPKYQYKEDLEPLIAAPLWQQAFDWLLPKLPDYNLEQMEDTFDLKYYNNKKEWEYIVMMSTKQDCLKELIELCKKN